ncbi:hypothetical protein C8J57DRAFT_1338412 [Mycena rebaudengoi]|nr:hypothetical protein C8J57DRAFT_1338412 [Mycena rebaudengoi]
MGEDGRGERPALDGRGSDCNGSAAEERGTDVDVEIVGDECECSAGAGGSLRAQGDGARCCGPPYTCLCDATATAWKTRRVSAGVTRRLRDSTGHLARPPIPAAHDSLSRSASRTRPGRLGRRAKALCEWVVVILPGRMIEWRSYHGPRSQRDMWAGRWGEPRTTDDKMPATGMKSVVDVNAVSRKDVGIDMSDNREDISRSPCSISESFGSFRMRGRYRARIYARCNGKAKTVVPRYRREPLAVGL